MIGGVLLLLACFKLYSASRNAGTFHYYIERMFGEDATIFASAFSAAAFSRVSIGLKKNSVTALLNQPLAVSADTCARVEWRVFLDGKQWAPTVSASVSSAEPTEVCSRLALNTNEIFHYTLSITNRNFLMREIGFDASNRVAFIGAEYWAD